MTILRNGMMNKQSIILTKADLFVNNIGTIEQRNQLIEEIKLVKSQNPDGIDKSNIGCWRWNNPCSDIGWLMYEIMKMLDQAMNLYNDEDMTFAQRKQLDLVNIDYWANINQPGSRNSMHSHKPAQFSACYYLQAEGTGGIRFVNPANIMAECNPGAPFTRDYRVLPKDGDLLLWPSWIPHEVETNFSDTERINLAFDIRAVE
jgi:uncharacterized protein (TIGR02466 family)